MIIIEKGRGAKHLVRCGVGAEAIIGVVFGQNRLRVVGTSVPKGRGEGRILGRFLVIFWPNGRHRPKTMTKNDHKMIKNDQKWPMQNA